VPTVGDEPETSWSSAVEIQELPELAREIARRLPGPSEPRAISVTDLVGLRRAYWRTVAPVRVAPERQERMERGRELHRWLEGVLATEGTLEARVRRDGIVGRIDVLAEVPVEVKSGSSLAPADELEEARPEQIEQLAMYCALTIRPNGRLVTLAINGDRESAVQVVDVAFDATEPVRVEMVRRAQALRRAFTEGRADELPACRWFARGCEYQSAQVCDCRGGEPPTSDAISSHVAEIVSRPEIAARIAERWVRSPGGLGAPPIARFRDLLYPRRAYFRRTSPEPPAEFPLRPPTEPADLYARVVAALESGPVGEVARLPPGPFPAEEEAGFRGFPYLLRTSRARARANPATLRESQPQYGLELGLRCAASGCSNGWLILGREYAVGEEDRLQVFDYRFSPVETFARLGQERTERLEEAVRRRAPQTLPACPAWMYPDCPYRGDCGCGALGERSQR
jgi:hypothetical protein